jgi:cysteine desulfurase
VQPDSLEHILREQRSEVGLVSVMAANNETGVIQPIAQLAGIARSAGVPFHTDATQVVGRLPVRMAELGVDLLSCSAHKLHGPKGVGALVIRRGVHVRATLTGGPQERERRAGTENVPGIVGFGVAAREALHWLDGEGAQRGAALRALLETLVLRGDPTALVNAADAPRLWNTTSIAFPRLEAEAILLALSERGVAASAGAACSSGSLEPSPVLLAMGIPPQIAHGSVRFSLHRFSTEDEIRAAAARIIEAVQAVRATSQSAVRA